MSLSPRTLLALLLLSVASTGTSAGQTDACAGRQHSTPSGVQGSDLVGRFPRGLLWKLEPAKAPPSYLFGTIHLDDPHITVLPEPVARAFDAAETYVMEVILDPRAAAEYNQAMYLPGGQTMQSLLAPELAERTLSLLSDYGVPRAIGERLKPWAAFNILARPKPQGGLVLDAELQQRADRQGKDIQGLESMKEVVAALDSIPLSDQVEILIDTVCARERIAAQAAALIAHYLNRDLAGLMAVNFQYEPHDAAVAERFNQIMLDDRSGRMADRIAEIAADGNAFIAVGALHLPGNKGILERLSQKGYQVTPIY